MTVMAESNWPAIARLFDARTARAMAVLLQAEGILVKVSPAVPGLSGAPMWQVQVETEQLEVALALLENSRFTDAELNYLATGLPGGEDR
jgi:hypothetical protein